MTDERKKFYITTAIDYVNGPPHIGHAIQKVWSDSIARYHRVRGERVWFLTGTDEHGVNIVRTAERLGTTPRALADENSAKFRKLREALDLSWDDFIRTSDRERHWPGATLLWRKLVAAGDIYKKQYRGLYCAGHEAFVTQKDLVDGTCALHGKEPEVIDEENYFFRLSRYTTPIRKAIETDALRIVPETRQHEILALLRDGLEDVSFSRPTKSVSWAIPVPGDPDQTMYVWCDALTNYLSAIGFGRNDEWQQWWPADVHVLGKDNLRFHAAIWPGMLLAAGLPLPKVVLVHGFVTVNGQKISKTIGNVVDPFALVKQYGTDPVRYYFAREISPHEDGDFGESKLIERYNGELANGLGNLVARVATLGEKVSPLVLNFPQDLLPNVRDAIHAAFRNYEETFASFRLNEALAEVWRLIGFTDRYLNAVSPWAVSDPAEFRKIIVNAAYLVSTVSNLLRPFLPETADKIQAQIRFEDSAIHIKRGAVLFPRLG